MEDRWLPPLTSIAILGWLILCTYTLENPVAMKSGRFVVPRVHDFCESWRIWDYQLLAHYPNRLLTGWFSLQVRRAIMPYARKWPITRNILKFQLVTSFYLPIQNSLNTASSTSSTSINPDTFPTACAAYRNSSAPKTMSAGASTKFEMIGYQRNQNVWLRWTYKWRQKHRENE